MQTKSSEKPSPYRPYPRSFPFFTCVFFCTGVWGNKNTASLLPFRDELGAKEMLSTMNWLSNMCALNLVIGVILVYLDDLGCLYNLVKRKMGKF